MYTTFQTSDAHFYTEVEKYAGRASELPAIIAADHKLGCMKECIEIHAHNQLQVHI
jgi:hypothetical protein